MTKESSVGSDGGMAEDPRFRAHGIGVSLTVRDLTRSIAWYRDAVGFTVARLVEREGKLRSAALAAGDIRILLNQDDGARGWERTKGEGFSILFRTRQDVDAIARRIEENGGVLDTQPADMPWGTRAFRFRDPDGFRLSIASEG